MPTEEIAPKTLAKQVIDILSYKSKRQPGAILLNGGSGVGKTYLWINEISPLLKDQVRIYVSMFGLKSVDELKGKVTATLVGEKGLEKSQWLEEFVKALPSAFLTAVSSIAREKPV